MLLRVFARLYATGGAQCPPPFPFLIGLKMYVETIQIDILIWFLCGKWFLEFPYGKSFVTLTAGPCSEAIGEVTRRHIRGWWQIVPKKHFLTPWVPRWQKHHVWCPWWCWYFIVVWWNFHFLKQSHNLPDIALEGAKNCRSCEELAFSFSHSLPCQHQTLEILLNYPNQEGK